ncbi:hypothetical protein E1176_13050 [Fulvivirga sp. RKSG066]|uniref:hypothetical protein n=1 Tax=Fulvivirga aurantia TaxID=2529383 RepID=UPI0012BCF47C|nr:hypothetical protein [Fulvivirga aurantia]MTI21953.1 hypothetical protein [Fulvivirga aurantia]
MNSKDYIIFIVGFIFVILSGAVAYKDTEIAGFMYAFGYGLIVYIVIRGIYLFIKKRISRSK